MSFRRDRFGDLVRRQLDLFAEDERELLAEADAAERAYDAAERDGAEEAYGDYQDRVDWAAQDLLALRDAYAATLDADTAAVYGRAFSRGVRRRFPALARAVETEDVD